MQQITKQWSTVNVLKESLVMMTHEITSACFCLPKVFALVSPTTSATNTHASYPVLGAAAT